MTVATVNTRLSFLQKLTEAFWMRAIPLAISLVLFVAACTSPALIMVGSQGESTIDGLSALVIGWMAPLYGQFAWYANPLLFFGALALLLRFWKTSIVFVILALFIAMDTFQLSAQEIPVNEGLTATEHLQSVQAGFYLWLASIVVIGLGAIVLLVRDLKLARK